jgi:hypothetical protein
VSEKAERQKDQRLLDLFGKEPKRRRPKTDQELDEWLTSAEGKAATACDLFLAGAMRGE